MASAGIGAAGGERDITQRVADLLGGFQVLRRRLSNPLDAHELLSDGLPGAALTHLVDNLQVLRNPDSLQKAVGMSLRTFQRRHDPAAATRPLTVEQSGRIWKFAEILATATEVFGSQSEAEAWMERPATGVEQCRPIDLLTTPVGVEIVGDFLRRLDYGVYT
jgi:putative toxin-antitoxin system antitoxin component (TIGR02293 family)